MIPSAEYLAALHNGDVVNVREPDQGPDPFEHLRTVGGHLLGTIVCMRGVPVAGEDAGKLGEIGVKLAEHPTSVAWVPARQVERRARAVPTPAGANAVLWRP